MCNQSIARKAYLVTVESIELRKQGPRILVQVLEKENRTHLILSLSLSKIYLSTFLRDQYCFHKYIKKTFKNIFFYLEESQKVNMVRKHFFNLSLTLNYINSDLA